MSKRKARVAATAAVLFFLMSGAGHAQADLQVQRGLTVFDSKGKPVGNVIGFTSTIWTEAIGSGPVVALKVNGVLLVVAVEPTRFVGTQNFLYFESSDCSGIPFVQAYEPDTRLMPRTAVKGDIIYAETGGPQTINPGSRLPIAGAVPPPICSTAFIPATLKAIQVVPLIDISAHFTPPFSMR
jgi:hypothetical protein